MRVHSDREMGLLETEPVVDSMTDRLVRPARPPSKSGSKHIATLSQRIVMGTGAGVSSFVLLDSKWERNGEEGRGQFASVFDMRMIDRD